MNTLLRLGALGLLAALIGLTGCSSDSNSSGDTNEIPEPKCTSDAECSAVVPGSTCDVATGACDLGCQSDADCTDDPANPTCNVSTGICEPAGCRSDADCAGSADGPLCDVASRACLPIGQGALIGVEVPNDNGESRITVTEVFRLEDTLETPDLAFHPERDELWVLSRPFPVSGLCEQGNPFSPRCRALEGETTIIFNPGTPEQTHETRVDGNSWHFMRLPPAMAMGASDTFATCGEASTGNFEDNSAMFIGPSLWSSDLDVYAQDPGRDENGDPLNGSHLDMLHATPFCMGIAHERNNVYWTFNGHVGSIDRYDFKADHGPGYHDHSDGEIFRYAEGEFSRVPGVPSHMVFNDDDAHLYIADSGNGRIVKLDTTSGTKGDPFEPVYERLADYGHMDGAVVTEVVPPGTVALPSGLAIHDGVIYVTDHASSAFHAFDLDGNLIRTLQTDLPEGSLAGIRVGPDGRLWFTDMLQGVVYRIDVALP